MEISNHWGTFLATWDMWLITKHKYNTTKTMIWKIQTIIVFKQYEEKYNYLNRNSLFWSSNLNTGWQQPSIPLSPHSFFLYLFVCHISCVFYHLIKKLFPWLTSGTIALNEPLHNNLNLEQFLLSLSLAYSTAPIITSLRYFYYFSINWLPTLFHSHIVLYST